MRSNRPVVMSSLSGTTCIRGRNLWLKQSRNSKYHEGVWSLGVRVYVEGLDAWSLFLKKIIGDESKAQEDTGS